MVDEEAVPGASEKERDDRDNSEDSDAQMGGYQPVVLEFCVALLVNILLHKDGPRKAEQIKDNILKALINLIESNISTFAPTSTFAYTPTLPPHLQ